MIKVSTQWVSRALSGSMVGGAIDIDKVSTDTRAIESGSLFIALKGANFDAHEFIEQAIEKGAAAVVVDHQMDLNVPQIVVENTTSALGALGAAVKAQLQPKTIAITGSVGKTTVKEMCAAILSRLGNVLATKGNFNNEIGVPLTLLRLDESHDYAVIEQGANHPGEIAYTTGLSKPDVCMINNVAAAHLEGFIDLYGVARAKGEIFTFSPEDSVAVVNCDSEFCDYWLRRLKNRPIRKFAQSKDKQVDVWVENTCMDEFGCATFDLYAINNGVQENVLIQLPVPGQHNIKNALAAASVTLSVGATMTDIALGLREMRPVAGRVNLNKVNDNLTVIDDSYNANLESAKAAVNLLTENAGYKILILGDMGELGPEARIYHEQVGTYAKEQGIDRLFTLGVLSQHASEMFNGNGKHFSSRAQLLEFVYNNVDVAKQKVTVLVKGSRSAKMELVVEALIGHFDNQHHDTLEAS